MHIIVHNCGTQCSTEQVFMAALRNRAAINFCPVISIFLSIFLFFPRLISAAAHWMSTILPHMVWPKCEFRMQV